LCRCAIMTIMMCNIIAKNTGPDTTEQKQATQGLAALLEQYHDEIATAWAKKVQQLPDSHYRELPLEDLRASTRRGLAAMIAALTTGSCVALEAYLIDVSLTRQEMNFDIGEVSQALLLCKDATLSVIKRSHLLDAALTWKLIAQLDACLRWMVGCFNELYATETNRLLQEQQARTTMMLDMVQTASISLELDAVLRCVAEGIATAAGVPHCGFFLVDEEQGTITSKLEVTMPSWRTTAFKLGVPWPRPPQPIAAFSPLIRQVVAQKEPVTCYDAQADPRLNQKAARRWGYKSVLALPCVVKGRVVAVAWVPTFDDCRAFAEDQIELACGLANAAAIAIENARLHQQAGQLAVIKERARLSREIHDDLAQTLGALQLRSSLLDELLSDNQVVQARANVTELQNLISEAYTTMREEIFNLRTIVSPGLGFLPSLREYLADYRAHYGLDVQLEAEDDTAATLTGYAHVQAMRIIQEALTNVRKHAGAGKVWVRIKRDDGCVRISVEDDGRGFDPARVAEQGRQYFGLQVMRERAESVGGDLVLESQTGKGTQVVLRVSLSPDRGCT